MHLRDELWTSFGDFAIGNTMKAEHMKNQELSSLQRRGEHGQRNKVFSLGESVNMVGMTVLPSDTGNPVMKSTAMSTRNRQ